ncbi:MAG TPA: hypothetical protein DIS79_00635 [Bacteroidetes bacterium]|nr:hypothetical protein [Bacteroidota bacterium]
MNSGRKNRRFWPPARFGHLTHRRMAQFGSFRTVCGTAKRSTSTSTPYSVSSGNWDFDAHGLILRAYSGRTMRTPADDAKKNSRSQSSVARQLAPYLALGSQLAASVLLPGGIGWYADKQLGTTPWLLVGGLVLGSVVGFVQFFRSVSQLTRSDTKRTKSRNI